MAPLEALLTLEHDLVRLDGDLVDLTERFKNIDLPGRFDCLADLLLSRSRILRVLARIDRPIGEAVREWETREGEPIDPPLGRRGKEESGPRCVRHGGEPMSECGCEESDATVELVDVHGNPCPF